jgi:hypothetical protein
VRFWSGARTQSDLQRFMFASGRDLPIANVYVSWGFDGNLTAAGTHVADGTLANGQVNACRFSAYRNELLEGGFAPHYEAHATVLDRATAVGEAALFPTSYQVVAPFAAIPAWGQIQSPINAGTAPTNATGVEVFLSVRGQQVSGMRCTLGHLSGSYKLFDFAASSGKHVLSFFAAGLVDSPNDAVYPAPWGFLVPDDPLPTTSLSGAWTLTCNGGGLGGVLQGWGLRFITP